MALSSTHPLFDAFHPLWTLLRDCYGGEDVVKQKGVEYLPPTPGMLLDGMAKKTDLGYQNYEAYKKRAVFHDFVTEAVNSYLGLLHQNPAVIQVPDKMKPLIKKATISGEPLDALLRRINEQQLITGRLGLLVDLPAVPDPSNPLPYLTMYTAESIRNWDDSDDKEGRNNLNMVILDESGFERQHDYIWKMVERYRLLELRYPGQTTLDNEEDALGSGEGGDPESEMGDIVDREKLDGGSRVYMTGTFEAREGKDANLDEMIEPMLRGQTLDFLPFVMINTKDIVAAPDTPPLKGLAQLTMTIYRGEADYRQNLFLQGQDTLVVIGGLQNPEVPGSDGVLRVGAGSRIDLDVNGDAKYIGVNSVGLPELRMSLENDKERAMSKSGALSTAKNANSGRESGDALRVRMAAKTATLTSIAIAGAHGLETALKMIARWMGEDEDEVKVTPNLEFTDFQVDGKEIVDLMTARTMGAPLSLKSIHGIMADRGLTQLTFDDEMELIDEEDSGRMSKMKTLGLDFTGQPMPPPPAPGTKEPGGKPPQGSGKKPPQGA